MVEQKKKDANLGGTVNKGPTGSSVPLSFSPGTNPGCLYA